MPGLVWPAIPSGDGPAVLGLLHQLDRTQWLAPDKLHQLQLTQLEPLLRHAWNTVPYYRKRWEGNYDPAAALTGENFGRLPLLKRRDLQGEYETLKSTGLPSSHGIAGETQTSGSTGMPVRVLKTHLGMLFWKAVTLRDHVWHRRDLRGKLAAIRHGVTPGDFQGWGPATDGLVTTGPSSVLGVRTDVAAQIQWLEHQRPDYLMTYPSNLAELAKFSLANNIRLPTLKEIRTVGELLPAETRELCRQAWQMPVTDLYSADEVGYIALQCPDYERYHAQSEDTLVEVLRDDGTPCLPGEVGRVVVTALHNFAVPLIRYEIGDYAEVDAPCLCGRGLPALRRIIGRVRNTLVTASGQRYWPVFGFRAFAEIADLQQHQFVQKSFDLIEARFVTAAPLVPDQEDRLRQLILSRLPAGFRVEFSYLSEIPRSAGGKFEDFLSEIAAGPSDGSR